MRQRKQTVIAQKKGNISRDSFAVGDWVRLQDVKTGRWSLIGSIQGERTADDGKKVSFIVSLDKGGTTIRHKVHMRHLTSIEHRVNEVQVRFADNVSCSDGTSCALRDRGLSTHTRVSKLRLRRQRQRDSYPALPPTSQ